jgi:type II secretory pathway pseudopilin PulG
LTWRCNRRADEGSHPIRRRETCRSGQRGAALIAVLVVLMLVSAIALGLALTTSLEPAITSAHEASLSSAYAAQAGAAIAIHELATIADWNLVLSGQVRSGVLQSGAGASLVLPDGTRADVASLTNIANCGHPAACSNAELDAFTTDRPWGPNNPRWQIFGYARMDQFATGPVAPLPAAMIVWVGDDPAELDGNPLRDSRSDPDGTRRPGSGVVVVRAEGFSIRSAHTTVAATVSRQMGGVPSALSVAWRDVR